MRVTFILIVMLAVIVLSNQVITLCEHTKKAISCGNGQVIHIVGALYGRTSRRKCAGGNTRNTKCIAPSSLQQIRNACHNKTHCVVYASNSVFGDPCRGTKKYLKVSYFCKTSACGDKHCNENAVCRNNACVCKRGYYGDGVNRCERSCLCMASGDPYYKTYDGQMIHFMGTCRYTLTRSTTEKDQCAYNVEVKNERRRGNTKVAYTRYVDVDIYGVRVRLHQGKKVYVDKVRKHLPFSHFGGKLRVYNTGRYVQLWSQCGIMVNFDGNHAVSVVVPGNYRKKMTGLCGDCDGVQNDFRTSDGEDVRNAKNIYSKIGSSYKAKDNVEEDETCTTQDFDVTCEPSLYNLVNKKEYCGELTNPRGRFSRCVKAFPTIAKQFYDACVIDVCSYEGEIKLLPTVKCNAVEAFAEECEEMGYAVRWRRKNFCPLTCESENMEYKSRGTGCPATCNDKNAPRNCNLEPREGCFCKRGFVLSDSKCVSKSECGCTDENDDYYPLNSKKVSEDCVVEYVCVSKRGKSKFVRVKVGKKCHRNAECSVDDEGEKKCICKKGYEGDGYEQCSPLCGLKYKCHPAARCKHNRCVCNKGLYGDGVNRCENIEDFMTCAACGAGNAYPSGASDFTSSFSREMCSCSASGDPHYRTYDGQTIHFMGICKYVLSKTSRKECPFAVYIRNERRGKNRRVSFTKTVYIDIHGSNIELHQERKVFVNGAQKYLPVQVSEGNVSITISGRFIRMMTKCGVNLAWDGKSIVRVSTPKVLAGKLTGICGDCNGLADDLRTSDGVDVSKEKNKYSLIGNSYLVQDYSTESDETCKTLEDDVTCSKKMEEEASALEQCGYMDPKQIAHSPFGACISILQTLAVQSFESCKFDFCAYYEDEVTRSEAVCKSLESLEEECETEGFNIRWRSDKLCPMTCDNNMEYSAAVSGCPATCVNPGSPDTCTLGDEEGCQCKPGFLLSGTNCVKPEQCGCKLRTGEYFPLNSTIVSKDCTTTETCLHQNGVSVLVVTSVGQRCHQDGLCGVVDGRRRCVCKDGYEGDGYQVCKELCGGKYKCHEDARCKSGTCVCQQGMNGDGINHCYESCTCTASGDPHYRTYDGNVVHFMGTCKYTLSKLTSNKTCAFDVEVKNENRNSHKHVSFTRRVEVILHDTQIKLHKGLRLTVNDTEMFTPFESQQEHFKIITKGKYITVLTDCGLSVSFDGKHIVQVTVPRQFGNDLTGICGNCNNQRDDYVTKDGQDVSKRHDRDALLGRSFEIIDNTGKPSKRCKTDNVTIFCKKKWEKKVKTNAYCGLLVDVNGAFSHCIRDKPNVAREFFESCKMDVCAYEDQADMASETACQSLEVFADICQSYGHVNLKWRRLDFCFFGCKANQIYREAIVGCPLTCEDPFGVRDCNIAPQEGCVCKRGFLLSGNNCVAEEDCGCYLNREYFPLGSSGPLTNCEQVQTCARRGGINIMEVSPRRIQCHKNAVCNNVDGMFKCHCIPGFHGDGVKKCIDDTEDTNSFKLKLTTSKPKTTTSKPKTTTPKRKRLDPRCRMKTVHKSCQSVTSVSGRCAVSSVFTTQCHYSVRTYMKRNYLRAFVVINDRKLLLSEKRTLHRDCAVFILHNNALVITDNICERCTLELIRSISSSSGTCTAPAT